MRDKKQEKGRGIIGRTFREGLKRWHLSRDLNRVGMGVRQMPGEKNFNQRKQQCKGP